MLRPAPSPADPKTRNKSTHSPRSEMIQSPPQLPNKSAGAFRAAHSPPALSQSRSIPVLPSAATSTDKTPAETTHAYPLLRVRPYSAEARPPSASKSPSRSSPPPVHRPPAPPAAKSQNTPVCACPRSTTPPAARNCSLQSATKVFSAVRPCSTASAKEKSAPIPADSQLETA